MTMLDANPTNQDFVPGFRFLTGGWGPPVFEPFGTSSRRIDLMLEVTQREDMAFTARDQHGVDHHWTLRHHEKPDLGTDARRMQREIVWAGPLPDGTIGEIATLADVILQSRWSDRPYLLLCEDVTDDGAAICSMVQEVGSNRQTSRRSGEGEHDGKTIGNAWFPSRRLVVALGADRVNPFVLRTPGKTIEADRHKGPGPQWKADAYQPTIGDLFLAVRIVTMHGDAVTIVEADMLPIRCGMDRESVSQWLPAPARPKRSMFSDGMPIANVSDLDDEVERAYSRAQPDEVIAIAVPEIAPRTPGERVNVALSHTGIRLHDADNLSDDLYGTDLDAGVWIGTDVTWHNCGDDGAEWSADWRRATRADIKRHGLSLDEIAESWADSADVETSADDIATMIGRDVAAEEAEAAKDHAQGSNAPADGSAPPV